MTGADAALYEAKICERVTPGLASGQSEAVSLLAIREPRPPRHFRQVTSCLRVNVCG